MQAHQRRRIRRCRHHHGPRQALLAKDVLDEVLDLAPPFADQPDHHHIGTRVLGHHAQQNGFAHAGAGKKTQTLATPHGQQAVDGAHADIHAGAHRVTVQRIDRCRMQGIERVRMHGTGFVQRSPQ